MKGYHYTLYKNWLKIKKEGLRPHLMGNEEFEETKEIFGIKEIRGIWVWKKKFKGLAHVGEIIYQFADKAGSTVVFLEVRFNKADILQAIDKTGEKVNFVLEHEGSIGNLVYHEKAESWIITKTILPERIKLLKIYNLLKLIK